MVVFWSKMMSVDERRVQCAEIIKYCNQLMIDSE